MLEELVAWAEIDLDAIAFNVQGFKNFVGDRVEVIAVVKANAYGHGAIMCARAALEAGATRLAVHRLGEGVELRQAGIEAQVLVLGYIPPPGMQAVVDWRLTPALMTAECAQALSARAEAAGLYIPVHVEVDTGLNRYGLTPADVATFVRYLRGLPGLQVEGLYTHFATADWGDQVYAHQQLQEFDAVLEALDATGQQMPLIHVGNSAGAMKLRRAHFHAIRPGISLYGMDPSNEWPAVFPLRPALTLKSRVSRVWDLPVGAAVSYGRTFIARQPTRAALVLVGYGDGYHRILSNRGSVLIHGQRAPILGRICMDQMVVDVGAIPGVQQNDEVVLVGRQGESILPAEEVADLAETINYEITTSLLPRITRVYRQAGQIVHVDGY